MLIELWNTKCLAVVHHSFFIKRDTSLGAGDVMATVFLLMLLGHSVDMFLTLLILLNQREHHNEARHKIEEADRKICRHYNLCEEPALNLFLELWPSISILTPKQVYIAKHYPDCHQEFESIKDLKLLVFDRFVWLDEYFLKVANDRKRIDEKSPLGFLCNNGYF